MSKKPGAPASQSVSGLGEGVNIFGLGRCVFSGREKNPGIQFCSLSKKGIRTQCVWQKRGWVKANGCVLCAAS